MTEESDFWDQYCPERGPMLYHRHSTECKPGGIHPGSDSLGAPGVRHLDDMCCSCGETPTSARMLTEDVVGEAGLIDDAKPLALPQAAGACAYSHSVIAKPTPLVGDDGLSWVACQGCGVMLEPKMATGNLVGPFYGIGRGWVTPRMRKRWEAIAYRTALIAP